jgi:Protein of unknown function (DUF1573)
MKPLFLIAIAAIAFTSCDIKRKDKIADDQSKALEQAKKDTTTVQIIDSAYNFGKVTDGELVEYSYRFKNSGSKPLVVTDANASCGCTVPEKPEKPIMPGEMGFIKIVFNSKGRVGEAHKTITVHSNAKPDFPLLELKGLVLDKNGENLNDGANSPQENKPSEDLNKKIEEGKRAEKVKNIYASDSAKKKQKN